MSLVILGFVVLLIGFLGTKGDSPLAKFRGLVILAGMIIIVGGGIMSTVKKIEAGHVGVMKMFGKVQDDVLYEGINFINPVMDVIEMDIRTQNYTMSGTPGEGDVSGDDATRVLSKDGLEVQIDLTILFSIIPAKAPEIIRKIGLNYRAAIIRSTLESKIVEKASLFNATDIYSVKKKMFEQEITTVLKTELEPRGILLEKLLVRKIKLPIKVKESIERKVTALQESERMQYVLQKEKQEAERKRVEAQGRADAQRILDASLTSRVLQFEQLQVQKELVNSPNSKVILLGNSKGSVPFILGK